MLLCCIVVRMMLLCCIVVRMLLCCIVVRMLLCCIVVHVLSMINLYFIVFNVVGNISAMFLTKNRFATSRAVAAHPSGAPEFTPGF